MSPPLLSHLATRNAELLKSGKYSDFTLKCGNEMFHLHKAIVCPESKVLAAALDGRFLEGVENHITLEDDDIEIVGKMLEFIYCNTYGGEPNLGPQYSIGYHARIQASPTRISDSTESSLVMHAKIYVIGDKYQIQGLKDLAKRKYEKTLVHEWGSETFSASVQILYEQTMESDRALKDIAVKVMLEKLPELFKRQTFSFCLFILAKSEEISLPHNWLVRS